jgi:hypothetical protein
MLTVKNHKQGVKTFSITFNVSNEKEVKQAKALMTLLGGFNSIRKEVKNEDDYINELYRIEATGEFKSLIEGLTDRLK